MAFGRFEPRSVRHASATSEPVEALAVAVDSFATVASDDQSVIALAADCRLYNHPNSFVAPVARADACLVEEKGVQADCCNPVGVDQSLDPEGTAYAKPDEPCSFQTPFAGHIVADSCLPFFGSRIRCWHVASFVAFADRLAGLQIHPASCARSLKKHA